MTRLISFLLTVASVAPASVIAPAAAHAQEYPTRPITVVVPFPPGGPTDVVGRVVTERMRASLGQPLVIENVTGAGGSIGVGRVAHASADGYTAVIGNVDTHVLNGAVYRLNYDIINDFEPVAVLSSYSFVLASRSAVPANDLKELIAWLKADSGKITQGTVGVGSLPHLCGIELQNRIGSRWAFVPYRGGVPAVQDLLAGHIDLVCLSPEGTLPLARDGRLKAYAILGRGRNSLAPAVPTADEAGLPGFQVPFWNALWMPKATPAEILAKMRAAVQESLNDAAVRARLAELGVDVLPPEQQRPEALAALQKSEIEKWWPIIKAAGIKAE
jgi:tripartite-type tricarboxylate transporter receptor subunit TctC